MNIIKYPLYNLDEKKFETLVAMICEEILGTGIIVFSEGKDGGRDGKFTGIANKFPSDKAPWNGKFIIQAKHTSKPDASCSDSIFKTILKNELPRIRRLIEDGKIDYYLMFTNRKLSGLQDSKIEDFLDNKVGVKNIVLGDEKIQLWLYEHSKIVKTLGLNNLLMPLQFYENDLQEIVIAFSETNISKEEIMTINSDLTRMPIEEKNRLNNLSKTYFDNVFKASFSNFEKIRGFFEDPKNVEYKSMYDNTISDLQEEIIIKRNEYHFFEDILNHLYKLTLDSNNGKLVMNRKLVRVFLHYMYFYCDIGKKVS